MAHTDELPPGPDFGNPPSRGELARALLVQEFGQRTFLIGSQGIGGSQIFRRFAPKQDGRTLPVIIAEIGTVLLVADQRGKLWIERTGRIGRIGQPLIFVGLQPA